MKVLIAVDKSQFAERILQFVSQRRWPDETEFVLIHVAEHGTGWFNRQTLESENSPNTDATATWLNGLLGSLRATVPNCQVRSKVLSGGASEVIVRAADDFDADLIIIGYQGAGTSNTQSCGGVAETVVHRAHCSVDIIKPMIEVSAAA